MATPSGMDPRKRKMGRTVSLRRSKTERDLPLVKERRRPEKGKGTNGVQAPVPTWRRGRNAEI